MKVTQKQKLTYILGLIIGGVVLAQGVSALTYQSEVSPEFTWDPSLSISLSSSELQIASLVPGGSAKSNNVVVSVNTNNEYGYTLQATVGNTGNNSNELRLNGTSTSTGEKFTMISASGSLSAGEWGYTTDDGTTYKPLSNSTTTIINKTTNASGTAATGYQGTVSTNFKIGASATTNQASGNYTNVINFTAVTNVAQ